jgi:hypothetical protein
MVDGIMTGMHMVGKFPYFNYFAVLGNQTQGLVYKASTLPVNYITSPCLLLLLLLIIIIIIIFFFGSTGV